MKFGISRFDRPPQPMVATLILLLFEAATPVVESSEAAANEVAAVCTNLRLETVMRISIIRGLRFDHERYKKHVP